MSAAIEVDPITLRVKQVDLAHRTLRLKPGSTTYKDGREAPMSDAMLQLLGLRRRQGK